jgi:hypothetical protein
MHEYVRQFVATYDHVFEQFPEELKNFRYHSINMRRVFGRQKREIPMVHRDGETFTVTPRDGMLTPVDPATLPKFGDYAIAAEMPFSDEGLLASPNPNAE